MGHEPSPRLDDCEGSTGVVRGGSPDVGNCAGFRTPAMRRLATGFGGRRRKSAKARNRGGVGTVGAVGSMGI